MPVEDVQLHGGHAVEVAPQNIEWDKVAAHVDHQPAPGETRLILNGRGRYGKAIGAGRDHLQYGLQSVENTERIRRR